MRVFLLSVCLTDRISFYKESRLAETYARPGANVTAENVCLAYCCFLPILELGPGVRGCEHPGVMTILKITRGPGTSIQLGRRRNKGYC